MVTSLIETGQYRKCGLWPFSLSWWVQYSEYVTKNYPTSQEQMFRESTEELGHIWQSDSSPLTLSQFPRSNSFGFPEVEVTHGRSLWRVTGWPILNKFVSSVAEFASTFGFYEVQQPGTWIFHSIFQLISLSWCFFGHFFSFPFSMETHSLHFPSQLLYDGREGDKRHCFQVCNWNNTLEYK